jgi:hypothetical protein
MTMRSCGEDLYRWWVGGLVGCEIFAEEDGGFGVLVVAEAVGVAAATVHGDGGLEVVLAVKVDGLEASVAGSVFEGVHEAGGEVVAAELGEDEEAFAFCGVGDGVEGTVEDAADYLLGGEFGEEEAVGVLVEGGAEGGFVLDVMHVSFAVVELKESVQGREIVGGGATDGGRG